MPPASVYAMALMVYVAVACLVWGVAALLAFPRATRTAALCVAAGMAGSFPGVFLFQILSVPIVGLVLLASGLVMSVTSRGGWIDGVLIGVALIAFGVFATASLIGFYVGWRAGWEVAAGRPVRDFLQHQKVLGVIFRTLGKWVSGFGTS